MGTGKQTERRRDAGDAQQLWACCAGA